jgi:hypothetical protein
MPVGGASLGPTGKPPFPEGAMGEGGFTLKKDPRLLSSSHDASIELHGVLY